ncbi:GNAT family N-acetyltransferase [Streptomyces sp. NPDC051815]|uniref:GNAT family N-acetyltransferase n=1 Tax=Streptomyces sp. NPDC051815 TaxID=3365674 RepID=UPI0037937C92
MSAHPAVAVVRRPGHLLHERDGLPALLTAYHLATEAEKGSPVVDAAALPERYRAEIRAPRTAFAADTVLLALDGPAGTPVGTAVVTAPREGASEIKRLWTDPAHRGRGIASVLLRDALAHCADSGTGTLRLSVWHWRTSAIALYERAGFRVTEAWDPRDGLVCMEHTGPGAARDRAVRQRP